VAESVPLLPYELTQNNYYAFRLLLQSFKHHWLVTISYEHILKPLGVATGAEGYVMSGSGLRPQGSLLGDLTSA
jgi:hypothetical protein